MHEHDNRPQIKFCPQCGTAVERRSLFGKERATCSQCGYIHFIDPKVAAGVLAVRAGKVLLVRRRHNPERGKWGLPAGFVDGGEDPRRAAERECREETGLAVEVHRLERVLYGRDHAAGADIMFVYWAEVKGGELEAGDDATEAGFFAAEELPALAFDSTVQTVSHWAETA